MDKDMDNYAYFPKSNWTILFLCLLLYQLIRNIDYGKTGYCHKRKDPYFRYQSQRLKAKLQ